jgi:sterol desaturase/sphingolipid hydroxylase (fatty acid hydroxylase superfamily)
MITQHPYFGIFVVLLIMSECLFSFYKKDGVYSLDGIEVNFFIGFFGNFVFLLRNVFFLWTAFYLKDIFFVGSIYNLAKFGAASLLLCLVLMDFIHYVVHLVHHKVHFLWMFHHVHHSDLKFNLSTNWRRSWIEHFYSIAFYLPLMLFGFSPIIIVSYYSIKMFYQMSSHNAYVSFPKFFDYIFITPSNHRNHHDQNRKYQDSNYGSILIIWDRMFGTYTDPIDTKDFKPGIKGYHQDNFIKVQTDPIVDCYKGISR